MSITVRKLPADDDHCGWIATLPPLPPPRQLAGTERADCAVLGAGFTGLAIARQLAIRRPDWRVVVVDAQRVGDGASGRNSGFIVDVGHYGPRYDADENRRRVRLARAGLDSLRHLVRTHAIGCNWTERGRLHGAVAERGMRRLEEFRTGLDAMHEPYEWLDAAAVTAITGTSYYRAATRTPGAVTMQPAALVRGLAAALPANAHLFENSPVRRIEVRAPLRLEADNGTVVADRLFLATNGYTAALRLLQQRVFPLFTFASLTRMLTEAEQAALGGDPEWGLVSEEPMGSTVRRTPDRRIFIRNTVQYAAGMRIRDTKRHRVRALHRHGIQARFPVLRNVEMEYTWGGVMGISLNGAHYFGNAGSNVFAAAGYNGVGVAMGTISGVLLADLAVGASSDLLSDMLSLPRPGWMPPEPVLGLAVRPALAYLASRARGEL